MRIVVTEEKNERKRHVKRGDMDRIKDDIHDCYNCDIYPCSSQEEISKKDICQDCPTTCCRSVLVTILPCEEGKLEVDIGRPGVLKMKEDGWCFYFDHDNGGCSIYENRPIVCRIASCRFVREGKVPEEFKLLKLKMNKESVEELREKEREGNNKNGKQQKWETIKMGNNKNGKTIKMEKQKKIMKVCALCGETFETTEEWRDTCIKCKRKPMFPDREAADEVVYH